MKVTMSKKISSVSKWGIAALFVFVSIGFAYKKQGLRNCTGINITIYGQEDNYFLHEEDVINILTKHGERFILETSFEELDLKSLERSLRENPFVKRADIYKDLKGTLIVEIEQVRPLARMLVPGKPDQYISTQGLIFPESKRFTARVPLISGNWVKEVLKTGLNDSVNYHEIKRILEFIHTDPFWKAQIAQLNISKNGSIKIYTQVGKQLVEFGFPEAAEEKFEKLKVFYTDILPRVGWNYYERVNLAFKDQIICE